MNNPLVSVVVPCYNQAQYLSEALQSVLEQTYTNWECIIVNDGSPDNTHEVAQEWLAKDLRFKYIYKENGGLSSARNAGITFAKGEYILPLDADDKISEDYTKLGIKAFEVNPELKLVYCRAQKFGEINEVWNLTSFNLIELSRENMIFCSSIYKKKDWDCIGGYDEKMVYGLEDWEFWIALLKKGGEVKKLEMLGFFYRIKENSMILTLNSTNDIREKQFAYVNEKHSDFFLKQKISFFILENKIKQLERDSYKNVTSKKVVMKIFFKVFFGINYF